MTAPWRPTWDRLLAVQPRLTAHEAAKIRGVVVGCAHAAARRRGKRWANGYKGAHWLSIMAARKHPHARSVTIHGETFPSLSAAARAYGVSPNAIWQAAEKGRLDKVGLGKGNKSKPVTIGAVRYPSMVAAADALGVSVHTVRKHMRAGTLKALAPPPRTVSVSVAQLGTTRGHGSHEARVSLPALPWEAA